MHSPIVPGGKPPGGFPQVPTGPARFRGATTVKPPALAHPHRIHRLDLLSKANLSRLWLPLRPSLALMFERWFSTV